MDTAWQTTVADAKQDSLRRQEVTAKKSSISYYDFNILLHPDMVDFSRPVYVCYGERVVKADFKIDEAEILASMTNTMDWDLAYAAHISFSTVNACYVPSQNSINFSAAILRMPFYDKEASLAYNMGGIGIVIGHEMSHAFDTNGSQYDKDGNLVNWWTDEDREAFRQKTQAVGERYAMYEILDGETPNADLVITETVADLAGASVVLDVLAEKENEGIKVNYEEFFLANATCWRRLLTKNGVQERLKVDSHAPDFLRVNVNISQFDKFYETFDIKEGDRMYTKPEDRLNVW